MDEIVITGLGVVSPAGVTRDELYDALAAGRSGVAPAEEYAATGFPLVARVGEFHVRQHVEGKALRRMVRLSQLGLVAARQALAQGMPEPAHDLARVGIVLGTGLGTLKETLDFVVQQHREGPAAASPLLFPSSVMNAAAGQMALELGVRGANSTVNHREHSTFGALQLGCDLLQLGRADALLVGGLDELNEWSHHGYRRAGALTKTSVRPYARDRDGTALGEGAAIVLLERAADARRRGARVLAKIAALASAGDHRPRVGWGRAPATAAASAIRNAVASAGLAPSQIDWIAGGGCGLALDGLEARAVVAAIGDGRPCSSIAGQIGEHMAAGAMRIAAAIYALERQALPGTVGAGDPDPEAPVAGLVREPRAAVVNAVLVPSLAEGGADAALVLTRP